MKDDFNKYGRKISEQEMVNAIAAIYPKPNVRTSHAARERFREDETGILIDHKLGIDYPEDKRQIIHDARERGTRRFLRNPSTLFKAAKEFFMPKRGAVPDFDDASLSLAARVMSEEFARESDIDTDDIIAFLGDEVAPYVRKLRAPKR